MAKRMSCIAVEAIVTTILLFVPIVLSDDTAPIPRNKLRVETWFKKNVGPYIHRKDTIDPNLAKAEASAKVIKVKADGSGRFKTLAEAINSIPFGNSDRVIVLLGGGNYTEKIKIDRNKPFVTLYGDPKDMPTLVYNGDAVTYGTVDSATLIVESDYFSAVNLNIVPRPDGKRKGAQAAALRIGGEKASFYNCKIYGFQDTLCDDKGKHFFKDSQARKGEGSDTGYSFVHCSITGTGRSKCNVRKRLDELCEGDILLY
ncbi:hypothetical protein LguiA_034718 [Lonicera macranthoides]